MVDHDRETRIGQIPAARIGHVRAVESMISAALIMLDDPRMQADIGDRADEEIRTAIRTLEKARGHLHIATAWAVADSRE